MKTIIAGGRDYLDYPALCAACHSCGWTVTEVVSGGATGVDALGERWGRENGIPVTVMKAEWSRWGKMAGPLRNRKMAMESQALIAMPGGHGTANMIKQAEEFGLRIYRFHPTKPS